MMVGYHGAQSESAVMRPLNKIQDPGREGVRERYSCCSNGFGQRREGGQKKEGKSKERAHTTTFEELYELYK